MVFCITDINSIGTFQGRHFNRTGFPWGEVNLSHILPSLIKYLYAPVSGVGNIDISPFVDIQSHGIAKFSVSLPDLPNSKDKRPFWAEYLDLIVGTVQDKDPSLFSDSDLSGLIEVFANFRDKFDWNMPYYLAGTDLRERQINQTNAQPQKRFAKFSFQKGLSLPILRFIHLYPQMNPVPQAEFY
jgi:hypothetical protein